jgi:hypothetical protein
MTIVNQIYVIAYGRNSRKPEDVSVGILPLLSAGIFASDKMVTC